MQLFSAAVLLAASQIVAGAPFLAQWSNSSHLTERSTFWAITGWGSPECQGSLLWAYEGYHDTCFNVPTEAASVTLYASTLMSWSLSNKPNCGSGLKREADPANTTLTETTIVTDPGKPVNLTGPGKPANLSATDLSEYCTDNYGGILAFRATPLGS